MMSLVVMMVLGGVGIFAARHNRMPGVRRRCRGDGGQTSAEYALVLLGVGAISLLVLGWATRTGKVGELLDAVYDSLIGSVV